MTTPTNDNDGGVTIVRDYCYHCGQTVEWRSVTTGTHTATASEHWRANGSATVWANGRATVTATGSATVRAYGSATVWANGSATVRAYGSATVTATDSATVWAYGSATVWANGSATVRAYGPFVVTIRKAKATKATGGTIVNAYRQSTNPLKWLKASNATMLDKGTAVLYKRTGADFGTRNGVRYVPGTTVTAPDWGPEPECGGGLHFCAAAFVCDQFRSSDGDRYVACAVKVADIVVHAEPQYPDKVKARECVVLYECDRDGNRIPDLGRENVTTAADTSVAQ